MVSINISPEKLQHLATTFQCQASALSFTYLGMSLCLNQPSVQDCWPLVQRIEVRLTNTSIWLTQGGKLEVVNSILSSMPTFYMCAVKVLKEIWKQVDKYRRHCLWKGGDMQNKKAPLTAWKMVTKPKKHGSLGVINLKMQNEALLLKHLHKFLNKADLPWVQCNTLYCGNPNQVT
jgi:hypothetical protein